MLQSRGPPSNTIYIPWTSWAKRRCHRHCKENKTGWVDQLKRLSILGECELTSKRKRKVNMDGKECRMETVCGRE